ncbi:hypothetical protein [Methylobacterium brachiatum]
MLNKALGAPFVNLDASFLNELRSKLGIVIPENPWWSFDYHFDWLHAVLQYGPDYHIEPPYAEIKNEPETIKGSQEDIDLIIAFEQTIILIEAKLSGSWNNKQMRSKAERMLALPHSNVDLHLVLASPKAPTGLKKIRWPDWPSLVKNNGFAPHHIELRYGDTNQDRLMVSRREIEGHKYYRVKPVYN